MCVLESLGNKKGAESSEGSPQASTPLSDGAHRREAACSCRESSGQLGFDLLHDAAKGSRIVHRQIGQDLAVDLDLSLLQAIGELAVRQTASAGAGVDTG